MSPSFVTSFASQGSLFHLAVDDHYMSLGPIPTRRALIFLQSPPFLLSSLSDWLILSAHLLAPSSL